MRDEHRGGQPHRQPTFAELFTPKLVTVLREGYGGTGFRADVVSSLTVAIVALPLSMIFYLAARRQLQVGGIDSSRALHDLIRPCRLIVGRVM